MAESAEAVAEAAAEAAQAAETETALAESTGSAAAMAAAADRSFTELRLDNTDAKGTGPVCLLKCSTHRTALHLSRACYATCVLI